MTTHEKRCNECGATDEYMYSRTLCKPCRNAYLRGWRAKQRLANLQKSELERGYDAVAALPKIYMPRPGKIRQPIFMAQT